mgnify:CR=1 FL=1
MLKHVVLLLMGIILIFTWMNGARASPIPITNASFESQSLNDGQYISSITGWIGWSGGPGGGGSYGVFNPKTAHFPSQAPEGYNTAYSNGGDFYQWLKDPVSGQNITLQPGLYTLTVKVGDRLDVITPFPGYVVRFQASYNNNHVILAEDYSSLTPANGSFITSTVTFNATPNNSSIGQPLVIALANLGGVQVNFDDVQLDYNPVHTPEPSTIILMGCGLIGLLGVVIKQSRKKSDNS